MNQINSYNISIEKFQKEFKIIGGIIGIGDWVRYCWIDTIYMVYINSVESARSANSMDSWCKVAKKVRRENITL